MMYRDKEDEEPAESFDYSREQYLPYASTVPHDPLAHYMHDRRQAAALVVEEYHRKRQRTIAGVIVLAATAGFLAYRTTTNDDSHAESAAPQAQELPTSGTVTPGIDVEHEQQVTDSDGSQVMVVGGRRLIPPPRKFIPEAASEAGVNTVNIGDCPPPGTLVRQNDVVDFGRNIIVHKCIAAGMQAMLDAAEQDGLPLSAASSWRTYEEQVQLRIQNCGSSDYAIYEMPSGNCYPATARPGTSNHNRGLAVDFVVGGFNSPTFNWLSENGPMYIPGWQNLASGTEPWHFSIDGG